MDQQKFREELGINIGACRRRAGLTQAELAQKLNYSDKAVSKWERGESAPDAATIVSIARLFGVSADELLGTYRPEPEEPPKEEKPRRAVNKGVILKLCSVLVWTVALLFFVMLSSLHVPYSWIGFVYAVPVNALVVLCVRSAWHDFGWNQALISIMVWGFLFSFCLTLQVLFSANSWRVMLLGIPGQIAIFLWFKLFRKEPPVQEGENG